MKTIVLKDIEKHTRDYADKCDILASRIQALKDDQEALRRKHITGIISASRSAKDSHARLKLRIAEHPHSFVKPRTHVFSGVRVGFKKAVGTLSFPDNIIDLINKKTPDQADVLIKTTCKPVAKALGNLDASTLKKLGVTITDAGDEIVIKATDSAVEKMVSSIMNSEVDDDTVF